MTTAKAAARSAADHPALRVVARVGFAVNGVLHLLIGAIAIGIAAGGGGSADQSGALQQLGSAPLGAVALWIATIALAALGVFLLLTAVVDAGAETTDRLKSVGKGVAYLAVAATALRIALGASGGGGGSGGGSQQTQSLSASLLTMPVGVVLVIVLGLAVAAIGVYLVVKGARRKFLEDLTRSGRVIVATGMSGYIAKGVAVVIVGVLFVIAAVTNDPSQASGLDGALTSLATLPAGPVVLGAVALGFGAFGVYSFLRARYAKL